MGRVRLGLDSFSYNLHLEHPSAPRDIRWFLDRLLGLGLDGCQVDPRHLRGWDATILQTVSSFCGEHGLYLELGTGGFGFDDISAKLEKAASAGARTLRTFHGGERHRMQPADVRQALDAASEALKRLSDVAERAGVVLAVENHGEFTSEELASLLRDVGHPFVRACLDTGNGMLVGEDPLECVRNLLPFAACVHLKDWEVRLEEDGPVWEDRPLGQGGAKAREVLTLLLSERPDLPVTIEVPTWGSRERRCREREDANVRESVRFARSVAGAAG